MAQYTIVLTLTDNQDSVMNTIATETGKTVQQILEEQVEEKVMGQVKQWIADRCKTVLRDMDSADALIKLTKK